MSGGDFVRNYFFALFIFFIGLSYIASLDCLHAAETGQCKTKSPRCIQLPLMSFLKPFYQILPLQCAFVTYLENHHLHLLMAIGVLISYFSLFYFVLCCALNWKRWRRRALLDVEQRCSHAYQTVS